MADDSKILLDQHIQDMELHEARHLGHGYHVLRVPGGWIYTMQVGRSDSAAVTSCFVPFAESIF